MVNEKKFLDQSGVEYLWSQLSLEDYPNNETLIAVINAIDETKANKNDIAQSDWDQNDEESIDYIKNRPFYEKVDSTVIDYDGTATDVSVKLGNKYGIVYLISDIVPTREELIGAIITYGTTTKTLTVDDIETSGNFAGSLGINGFYGGGGEGTFLVVYDLTQTTKFSQTGIYSDNSALTIELINTTLKQLDEKFIPDTIAHKDYVDSQVAALVNAAPETLDTLGELATALEENKEVVEVLDASITNKQDKITGTSNQLVGFDENGNMIAKTPTTETWTFTLADGTVVTK